VTLAEFLNSILTLSASDKSLDESLKKELEDRILQVRNNPLLSPFLNQTLDKAFSKL
jgi:hypothetical protein